MGSKLKLLIEVTALHITIIVKLTTIIVITLFI